MKHLCLLSLLLASQAFAAIGLDATFPICVQKNNATGNLVTGTFSTAGTNRIIVAAETWTGATAPYPQTISGAGLTWASRVSSIFTGGSFPNDQGASVWTATAASTLTSQTVTSARSNNGTAASGILCVWAFSGASATVGASGTKLDSTCATTQLIDATVNATGTGSWVVGAFTEGNTHPALAANANSTLDSTLADATDNVALSIGHLTSVTTGPGNVIVGTTTSDKCATTAALEICQAVGCSASNPSSNHWFSPGWGALTIFKGMVQWMF